MSRTYPPLTLALNVQPMLDRLGGVCNEQMLTRARRSMANAVAEKLRANFTALGGTRFWAAAAGATVASVLPSGDALVEVRQPGVALQRFGGTVSPGANTSSKTGGKTKLLAIPANGGDTPPNLYPKPLRFVPLRGSGKTKGMLVERQSQKGKSGAKRKARVAYWLLSATSHRAHENVLPTDEQLLRVAADVMRFYLNK